MANGETVLKNLDELKELEKAEDAADEEQPAEKDAMLRESGHILIDLITARRQVAALELGKPDEG